MLKYKHYVICVINCMLHNTSCIIYIISIIKVHTVHINIIIASVYYYCYSRICTSDIFFNGVNVVRHELTMCDHVYTCVYMGEKYLGDEIY